MVNLGVELDKRVWNIEDDDSTGGGNRSLMAYNGNKTKNVQVKCGKLEIIAKPEWYVQRWGYKVNEPIPGVPPEQRVARPYTRGKIHTYDKVNVDMGKPGFIEVKFKAGPAAGSWPATPVRSRHCHR